LKDFKDTFFYTKTTSISRGKLLDWSRPKVMGILNVTPDSFFDGGVYNTIECALHKADEMILAGVDIIDIGGYSSRPQSIDISEAEELHRVIPVIKAIREKYPQSILSIDTFRAVVANEALEMGVNMVNDITGGMYDVNMFDIVAKYKAIYCMMHMKGTPQTMLLQTDYSNLFVDILDFFNQQIIKARAKGILDILIDPGFGFAKTESQNYQLLKHVDIFKVLELPILIGVSRKSMIYKPLEIASSNALNGSTVLHTFALQKGAMIFRVHDVHEMKEAITLVNKVELI
jgi:dihydropteroate synthase